MRPSHFISVKYLRTTNCSNCKNCYQVKMPMAMTEFYCGFHEFALDTTTTPDLENLRYMACANHELRELPPHPTRKWEITHDNVPIEDKKP